MKNSLKAIAIGLVLGFATSSVAHARSEFASILVTPLFPTNSNPGNVVLYEVTVERTGQGLLGVEFSSSGLPDGCNASFAPNPVRFTGRDPRYISVIMTVTGNEPVPTDTYAFSVTGAALHQRITSTNLIHSSSLTVTPPASLLVSLDVRNDGDVELRGLGDTAQSYQIETTTDLANPAWTSVGSCTADGNGRFMFVHSGANARTSSMGFYRAVTVVPANP